MLTRPGLPDARTNTNPVRAIPEDTQHPQAADFPGVVAPLALLNRLLDDKLTGLAMIACSEGAAVQQRTRIRVELLDCGALAHRSVIYAERASESLSSRIICSRIMNFCGFPVAVIGNSATNRM
jgi:hypothetical protein